MKQPGNCWCYQPNWRGFGLCYYQIGYQHYHRYRCGQQPVGVNWSRLPTWLQWWASYGLTPADWNGYWFNQSQPRLVHCSVSYIRSGVCNRKETLLPAFRRRHGFAFFLSHKFLESRNFEEGLTSLFVLVEEDSIWNLLNDKYTFHKYLFIDFVNSRYVNCNFLLFHHIRHVILRYS